MRKNPLLMIPLEQYQLQDQQPIGDQLAEAAAARSYARSTPTAAGNMGRIQAGTYMLLRMVDSVDPQALRIHSIPPLSMSLAMMSEINRYPLQPFCEALIGFNKQAKKFRKRL